MKKKDQTFHTYRELPLGRYHLVMDKLQKGGLFQRPEEYVEGMNTIALCQLRHPVRIVRFVLMWNHVHVILTATGSQCVDFFISAERRLSRMMIRSGRAPLPADYSFLLVPIRDDRQLADTILYVDRNPYETSLNLLPGGYLWGTGCLGFSETGRFFARVPASGYSVRDRCRMFHTRQTIPGWYGIHPETGMIYPDNYVDTQTVIHLFKSAARYQTRLSKAYEAFVEVASSVGEESVFSGDEVADIIRTICHERFKGVPYRMLGGEDKETLMVLLHRNYRLSPDEIAKHLSVSGYYVRQMLQAKKNR